MKLLGSFLVVVLGMALWTGYLKIESLQSENRQLTTELKTANDALDKQIALLDRIEAATTRLEMKEQERQVQYDRFETRLRRLATQNEHIRSVLDTVIPDELLHGLHPFRTSESKQGSKKSVATDCTPYGR